MNKDHGKIFDFLFEFESCFGLDISKIQEMFNTFKWNLERHLFLEEKALFEISGDIMSDEVSNIFDLMKDHGDILEIIKKIENNFSGDFIQDFINLKQTLKKHVEFEDMVFYPRLDDKLSDDKKKEMISRIKEVIAV